MPSTHLFGPLIATADVEPHLDILVDALGFEVAERTGLSQRQVRDRLGVVGRRAELIVLLAPESESGVCLVEFDPPGTATSSPTTGPIEIQLGDPAATLDQLNSAGVVSQAEQGAGHGESQDARWAGNVQADDGVVYALIASGESASAGKTELLGVDVMTGQPREVAAFYAAIGVPTVSESAAEATSGPMLRVMAEAERPEESSEAAVRLVDLGVVALCLWVDDVDAVSEAAVAARGERVHRSADGGSVLLRGPDGALHWLIRASG